MKMLWLIEAASALREDKLIYVNIVVTPRRSLPPKLPSKDGDGYHKNVSSRYQELSERIYHFPWEYLPHCQ